MSQSEMLKIHPERTKLFLNDESVLEAFTRGFVSLHDCLFLFVLYYVDINCSKLALKNCLRNFFWSKTKKKYFFVSPRIIKNEIFLLE